MITELMDRFVEFEATWLWLVLLATWRALPILILVTGIGLSLRRKLTPSLDAMLRCRCRNHNDRSIDAKEHRYARIVCCHGVEQLSLPDDLVKTFFLRYTRSRSALSGCR